MALRVAREFRTVRYETCHPPGWFDPHQSLVDPGVLLHQQAKCHQPLGHEGEHPQARATGHHRSDWQSRKHGDVPRGPGTNETTHGFFRDYLCRNGFTLSSDCQRCSGVPETAEHAVFECPRFAEVRQQLLGDGSTDPVRPETLQQHLLRDAESWRSVKFHLLGYTYTNC